VLVAVAARLYRDGLAAALRRTPGIEVVGTAAAWSQALIEARASCPDMVLVDLPLAEAPAAVRGMRELGAPVHVVVIVPSRVEAVIAWQAVGVCTFIDAEATFDDLLAAIRRPLRQACDCVPRTGSHGGEGKMSGGRHDLPGTETELTSRELQVLGLLEQGLSNKGIAAQLQIELPTVKNHVHHVLLKLDAGGRSEAVAKARRHGLLGVPAGSLGWTA
jgi:two-component system, NarL family, nitrate/nitrite response regulator NarL